MFMSQDDGDFVPRERCHGVPHKKPRSNFSHLFDDSIRPIGTLFEPSQSDIKEVPQEDDSRGSREINVFKLSQESDSVGSSQFSQDFTDRLGLMNMKNSQDISQYIGFNSNSNSSLLAPGEEICFDTQMSWDGSMSAASIKTPRTAVKPVRNQSKVKTIQSQNASSSSATGMITRQNAMQSPVKLETERIIDIAPPTANVFTNPSTSHKETYIGSLLNPANAPPVMGLSQPTRKVVNQPTRIWISPFQERPKYITEFEEIALLGEGTFSVVTVNRHRVDGSLYAIKKMKTPITNKKIGKLQLKEVHALSVLQGGPNMLQYHSAWIDSHYLYIQTELCHLGCLEDLISTQPSTFSVMNVNNHSALSGMNSTSNKRKITDRNRSNSYCAILSGNNITSNYVSPAESEEVKYEGISEELAWFIVEQIASSLNFMHSKGLVHLDLRPANVFLTTSNNFTGQAPALVVPSSMKEVHNMLQKLVADSLLCGHFQLRLGDFGHCVFNNNTNLDSKGATFDCGLIEGETRYCARELINTTDSEQHLLDLSKADVFSLGATVYELCLGTALGQGENASEEWHSLRDGMFHGSISEDYTPALVDTLKALMHPDPLKRPSAAAIVAHCQTHIQQLSALPATKISVCSPSSYMSPMHHPVPAEESAADKYSAMLKEIQKLKQENDELRRRCSGLSGEN